MIPSPSYKRYFFLTAGLSLVFTFLGSISALFIIHNVARPPEPPSVGSALVVAQMIDHLLTDDPVLAQKIIMDSQLRPEPLHFTLVNQPPQDHILPTGVIALDSKHAITYEPLRPVSEGLPGERHRTVIRLKDHPSMYLVADVNPPQNSARRFHFIFNVFPVVFAILVGTALSIYILLRSFREKSKQAASIISELQSGNLKARFPISKIDEFGQTMIQFNKMADEIEKLVERLQNTEQSRKLLLQELAHDLRTPVASLRNMLEILAHRYHDLNVETRTDFFNLSLREIEYVQRLIDDLLFLAQVSQPEYRSHQKLVNISDIVEEEMKSASHVHPEIAGKTKIDMASVHGDSHLIRRMVKNAIDNAYSFAKAEVSATLEVVNDKVSLIIADDGPGLSAEAMAAFGKRRATRVLENQGHQKRVSVGLGSVIMKTVAESHGGELNIKNREATSHAQIVHGAELKILLPIG